MKKRAAMLGMCFLLAASTLCGCADKEQVETTLNKLLSDIMNAEELNTTEEKETEQEKNAWETIDTSIPIPAGIRIAVVSKNTKGEFWEKLYEGMKTAVSELNESYGYKKEDAISMTFEGADDETKVELQINTVDAVLSENPDVLCLSVSDMDSCQAQLEMAAENGIPVIVFDSTVSDDSLVTQYCATNNRKIGEMGALYLSQALGKMGKVAVFSTQGKTSTAVERTEGFLKYMEGCTDMEVVSCIYSDQVEDFKEAMSSVINERMDLDGVFCTNAETAELYLSIEQTDTEKELIMIGVDATAKQVEAVRNGTELGIVSQNPYQIGYQTILSAAKACVEPEDRKTQDGEEFIRQTLLSPPVWLELDTIDREENAIYIY